MIQHGASNGATDHARRIPALGTRRAGAGDQHPVDRQSVVSRMERQPGQQRDRAGIERVAAQLVARKGRPLEQPHPQPGARQHYCRDRARGAAAHHDHVVHWRHRVKSQAPSSKSQPLPSSKSQTSPNAQIPNTPKSQITANSQIPTLPELPRPALEDCVWTFGWTWRFWALGLRVIWDLEVGSGWDLDLGSWDLTTLAQHHRAVLRPEPQAVAEHRARRGGTADRRDQVEAAVGIGRLEVDRRRQVVVGQREADATIPDAPLAPWGWPIIDLVDEPGTRPRARAEQLAHAARLDRVVEHGRRAVDS